MNVLTSKQLAQVMRELAKVPSRATRKIAEDLNKEIQRSFSAGVDPYGKPWRKLAKSTLARGRKPPPLTDTRKGRRSVKVKAMPGAGIRFTVEALYMLYHLFGGPKSDAFPYGRPPKRSFLPVDGQRAAKMPPKWLAIINKRLMQAALKAWNG